VTAGKRLAPTNKAAETAAAKAAEKEFWRLCDMSCTFLNSSGLGYDRSDIANGWPDTGANQYSGRENGGDGCGDIREHLDFLSS